MNSFDFQTGFTELDVDDNRNVLKNQLTKTLQLSINLNKPIRRRIERLLFVASTKDEQVEIKNKPKPVNTNTAQKTRNQNQQTEKSQSSFQKAAAASQLNELPSRISNAKSGIELETHLNSLSDLSIEDSGISELQKDKLVESLEALLTDTHPLKDSLNAKARRRVKRLIERVRSPPTTGTATEQHSHDETKRPVTAPTKPRIPAVETFKASRTNIGGDASSHMASKTKSLSQPTPVDTMPNWKARIAGLRTPEGLDTLLDTLTEASVESYSAEAKQALSEALATVQTNHALTKNSKQRRKTTRLIDRLAGSVSAPTAAGTDANSCVFGDRTVGTWDEEASDNKRIKVS